MAAVAVDPVSPDIVYAAVGEGPVYASFDRGENWLPTSIRTNSYSHGIAATESGLCATVGSEGIACTRDGGSTWQHIRVMPETWIDGVVFSPHGGGLLLATSHHRRLFLSRDEGESWSEVSASFSHERMSSFQAAGPSEFWVGQDSDTDGGLFHSVDGGVHWERQNPLQPPDTDVVSVLVAAGDPELVFVGYRNVHNEGRAGSEDYFFKTEDGGDTWQPIRYPFDPDAGGWPMANGPDGSIYINQANNLWRSMDRGDTWTLLDFRLPRGMRPGDFGSVAVDGTRPQNLYVAVLNGVLRSTDAGQTWALKNEGMILTSVSLLAAHPSNTGTVYAASAGGEGTYRSTDYGESWSWLNAGGLPHPWADELVIDSAVPDTLYEIVDVADIYRSTDGGDVWNQIWPEFRFSSVYSLAVAPSHPRVMYGNKNGFGIFKSGNGGEDWRFLHQSGIDYTYSIAVHPHDPHIVFSGYNPKPFEDRAMVRRTTDGGDTWDTVLEVPSSTGVTSVAIDPSHPDTVYAGSTGQGGTIWASRDGGDTWSVLHDSFNFTNVHVMTTDPVDPDAAYAGVWGGGTFKTSDGGRSWSRLPNDPTISASAILIDPTDTRIIYLADRTSPRIYRTVDGGATWEVHFDAGPGHYRVMTAALAPGDPATLYASVFARGGPMAGDVFRIEDGEATRVAGALPRLPVALTVDPDAMTTVYAALHGYGVYRTLDGGESWFELSGPGSGLPQSPAPGFNGVLVAPDDPDTLYLIGGCDVDVNLNHTGVDPTLVNTVYRSTDGGANWTNLNDGNLGANSGQVKSLAVVPGNPDTLYLGAANGVFFSADRGASWTDATAGLPFTATAGVNIAAGGQRIYAPTLGAGVFTGEIDSTTHALTWDPLSHLTAEIYHMLLSVDPSESDTIYASAYPGGVFKSIDGGVTWVECNFGMASFEIEDPRRQGYYAFAVSPSDPQTLYLGLYGVGIYKSSDGAGTWQPANGSAMTMRGLGITALAVDPLDSDTVYVATEDGVYRTTDGAGTWSDFSDGLISRDIRVLILAGDGTLHAGSKGYGLFRRGPEDSAWRQGRAFGSFGTFWPMWDDRPLYQYTSLLLDPTDRQTMYLGTFPAGIYKTTDGGQTWREHNVGWTNDGVFSLVTHPDNPDVIYAGTYNGVNRSTDRGEHWELWDEGWPAEQWVFSIVFDPTDPDTMYACAKNGEDMGRGRDGFHGTVMKSVDGGATWFEVTTGLNVNQEFYELVIDPESPRTLYLATAGEGVFITRDGGGHWTPWVEGLGNLMAGTNGNNVSNVLALSADGNVLYFATSGSGVWRRMLDH